MAPKKGGRDNRPPIFVLIEKGNDSAVEELLKDEPGNRDLKNSDGWTPLIAAAYCGKFDVCKLLLKVGADVKASCRDGDTALHYACAQGHIDIVELLAKSGAKLEVKDKDGETPYNVAGKNLKVRKLIQQLIDAKLQEEDGEGGEDDEGEGDDGEWEEVVEEDAKALAAGASAGKSAGKSK
ncbi:hypothetical protein FOA52_010969 [Chlamydomonas sp. UWO 241]|nr:hypothetical protein FOA52_010969 [Chlamydomonas sp. UWO 241]